MNGTPLLRLEHEQLDEALVVRVLGEVDRTTAAELADALSATTSGAVVLDLTDVSFLDSAGVRTIEAGRRDHRDGSRAFVVVAPSGSRAAWTLRIAGFDDGLVHESLESALGEQAPS